MEFGRLESLRAREAWAHEAHDFTPWLLENADALGQVLGMDLELTEAEHSVGGFSLDLIGVDLATNENVIIENQLEKSDHTHLGQLLTYAGGTNPANIIWIADSFRDEHRAALDWLNERTDEHTRFFAVQISAVRIGNSAIAPLFTLVVQPNDWEKEVRATAAVAQQSPREAAFRRFWQGFLDRVHAAHPTWTNSRSAQGQNWMNLPAGVSVANYAVVFTKEGPRVELYFTSSDPDANVENLAKVQAHQLALEAAFGHALNWDDMGGRKAARVSYGREGDITNEAAWDEYLDWFVTNIAQLRSAIDSVGGLATLLK